MNELVSRFLLHLAGNPDAARQMIADLDSTMSENISNFAVILVDIEMNHGHTVFPKGTVCEIDSVGDKYVQVKPLNQRGKWPVTITMDPKELEFGVEQ